LGFRGSFNRDVERLGADFWGPRATGGRGWSEVADHADLARLAQVSRARITQITDLLLLASDVQKAILFLSRDAIRTWPVPPRLVRGTQRLSESP